MSTIYNPHFCVNGNVYILFNLCPCLQLHVFVFSVFISVSRSSSFSIFSRDSLIMALRISNVNYGNSTLADRMNVYLIVLGNADYFCNWPYS